MKIRRYYPEGFKGKTYSDEYIKELAKKGVDTYFVDNAKIEVVLTRKEQEEAYKLSCDLIMTKTRWVLDNLEHLYEYQVNWINYGKNSAFKAKNRNLYK